MSAARTELLVYALLAALAYSAVILPHAVDYGWAWGWPGAGLGLPLSVLGSLLSLAIGLVSSILVFTRPKRPRLAVALRIMAVPALAIGPSLVSSSFGGLMTSVGRGLADRVRYATPVETLQSWAVDNLDPSTRYPLPREVAITLPGEPRVEYFADHVMLRWYDRGLLVGGPAYRTSLSPFFLEEIRPGVYAYVVEK